MIKTATSLACKVSLNDGSSFPMFGLGMYKSEHIEDAVMCAIKKGYRLIDTAEMHGTEAEIGRAVKKCGLPREEISVVSKVLDNGADLCKSQFAASLEKFGLDYIDLYMIHSPRGGENVATYKTMMGLQKQGLIRSIGVSNFGVHHLQALIESGVPLPVINQIELHPWQQKRDIVKFCREKGITVMGYCPLSKGHRFKDKTLKEMASRYNKSPAQVMIRWSVQNGFITIPKSSRPARIVENAQVFDWTLEPRDMDILNHMPQNGCTWNPCEDVWEG